MSKIFTMDLGDIKKMLRYYRDMAFDIETKDYDHCLSLNNSREIIEYLESVSSHLVSYIELIGLRKTVTRLVITEQITIKPDRYGNFTRNVKVYTISNDELINITKETAFALGCDFVYLQDKHKRYSDQHVMTWKRYSTSKIAIELGELLKVKLEHRDI